MWPVDGRLADAGVLIHTFDGWEDNTNGRKWSPDATVKLVSASLIYAAQREANNAIPTYAGQSPTGLILRPGYTRAVCGCARDCGARCIGAYGSPESHPVYCNPAAPANNGNNCVWQPGPPLGVMFDQGRSYGSYNEVIVDAQYWGRNIPEAIEAIIGDPAAHQALLNEYPYLSPADVPLLWLNTDDWYNPFFT